MVGSAGLEPATSLAEAHGNGVLHRDLKPSNVMLDGQGRARITDFGLAIAIEEAGTSLGAVGTPGYLAPELMSGGMPTVRSDLYALGLVLYEGFTGKRAFEASSFAEIFRKQTETNPTPPTSLVKTLDPNVERVILCCLEKDPARRPRSAEGVAAGLPGGDPLAAILAAGDTPSPEIVAAAGAEGSLRPGIAWVLLLSTVAVVLGTAIFLLPRVMDWGMVPMTKSPEVLANRAEELAEKLGYTGAVDRAFWFATNWDYRDYLQQNSKEQNWKKALAEKSWPSIVEFHYRQSPEWMAPRELLNSVMVSNIDPPMTISGMAAEYLDLQGRLVYFRGIPPQVETEASGREPNWDLLFEEAGLDKSKFEASAPK